MCGCSAAFGRAEGPSGAGLDAGLKPRSIQRQGQRWEGIFACGEVLEGPRWGGCDRSAAFGRAEGPSGAGLDAGLKPRSIQGQGPGWEGIFACGEELKGQRRGGCGCSAAFGRAEGPFGAGFDAGLKPRSIQSNAEKCREE